MEVKIKPEPSDESAHKEPEKKRLKFAPSEEEDTNYNDFVKRVQLATNEDDGTHIRWNPEGGIKIMDDSVVHALRKYKFHWKSISSFVKQLKNYQFVKKSGRGAFPQVWQHPTQKFTKETTNYADYCRIDRNRMFQSLDEKPERKGKSQRSAPQPVKTISDGNSMKYMTKIMEKVDKLEADNKALKEKQAELESRVKDMSDFIQKNSSVPAIKEEASLLPVPFEFDDLDLNLENYTLPLSLIKLENPTVLSEPVLPSKIVPL